MTHDELLAKITTEMFQFKKGGFSRAYMQALRAIVELHKPIQISNEQLCNACEEWTNEGQKQLFYPCPTIQEIEKAMK